MLYEEIELKHTPFKKIDKLKEAKSGERVHVGTDISPEDFQIIEEYILKRDPEYKPQNKKNAFDKSKFLKELLFDFINNVSLKKKSFKDLYILLLLPKTEDPDELDDNGQIVGAVQTPDGFYMANAFRRIGFHAHDYNFIFSLKDFDEETYKLLFFDKLEERAFFCVDESIQHDFFKTKARLSEVYEELDLDDCYFTIINVNNYFDYLDNGQYISQDMYTHEGVIVLVDYVKDLKICMSIDWNFTAYKMELAFNIIDEKSFNEYVIYQARIDELIEEYFSTTPSSNYRQEIERDLRNFKEIRAYFDEKISELEGLLEDDERDN